ncbi:hypothetical protein YC2023_118395 [Brassica napus]
MKNTFNLIDSKLEEHHYLCGSKHCPGCGRMIQAATKPNWFGLPAGVKFDPTDQELVEHLEAKVKGKEGNKKWFPSHPLIDEFIPTIDGEDGICYTHPQKLPGVTKDGLSKHFFHKPSRAYTTGTRKRRKIIQTEHDSELNGSSSETRWHKTGKTRPVMINGRQRGCKKILVLYTNFGKNRRPEKTNWVMHQYHLGINEEEREGELVVSKIFYQTQPRQCVGNINWSEQNVSSKGLIGIGAGDEICGVAAALQSLGSGDVISRVNTNPFTRAFDEQQQLRGRSSGSGLEDLIMGCTSTCTEEVNHVTVFFLGTTETMNILHKLTIRPVTISQEPNRVRWSKPEILTEPEGSREVLQTMGLAFDQCWKCLAIYSLCH